MRTEKKTMMLPAISSMELKEKCRMGIDDTDGIPIYIDLSQLSFPDSIPEIEIMFSEEDFYE